MARFSDFFVGKKKKDLHTNHTAVLGNRCFIPFKLN